VRLLASFRRCLPEDHTAQAGYQHQVPVGVRVGDVLSDLPIPKNEAYTFFVNGRHAAREQVLQEGDTLAVFPAVGGGH
jgi:molybdopterin converting factor small subunit